MSGHIFFSEGYYGFDDALYSAVKVLEILNEKKKNYQSWLMKYLLLLTLQK